MKIRLAIIVLVLFVSGCSENNKLVILDCKLNRGNFELVIDLKKNTMKFFLLDPYTITNVNETEITANNLDQLPTPGALRHYLTFKRYGGEFISAQY